MAIQVNCQKGCGHSITVTDEVLAEAAKSGVPLDVSHDVCPNQDQLPEYRVVVIIERIVTDAEGRKEVTQLARNGSTVSAKTFAEGYEEISKALGKQWTRVGQMKHIVEMEDPEPQPDSEDSKTGTDAAPA